MSPLSVLDGIAINEIDIYTLKMEANALKDNKRISMIFITQTGKKDEEVLRLITVWELAEYLKIKVDYSIE